jgi:hypothetical protein
MYPLSPLHEFAFFEIIPTGAELLSGSAIQADPWYLYLRSIIEAAATVSEYNLHPLPLMKFKLVRH